MFVGFHVEGVERLEFALNPMIDYPIAFETLIPIS